MTAQALFYISSAAFIEPMKLLQVRRAHGQDEYVSSAALIEPMKLLQVRRAHGQDEYVFKYRLPVGFARATAVA